MRVENTQHQNPQEPSRQKRFFNKAAAYVEKVFKLLDCEEICQKKCELKLQRVSALDRKACLDICKKDCENLQRVIAQSLD